jgi:hypothetical protein
MSLKGIRDAVQTSLDNISGLRVYDTVPDQIQELPACWVKPSSATYNDTFADSMTHNFECTILVARGGNLDEVQDTLDDLLEPTGSGSIPAYIHSTSLSTHGSDILVTGYRDYGGLEFNGTPYIGAKVDFLVMVD